MLSCVWQRLPQVSTFYLPPLIKDFSHIYPFFILLLLHLPYLCPSSPIFSLLGHSYQHTNIMSPTFQKHSLDLTLLCPIFLFISTVKLERVSVYLLFPLPHVQVSFGPPLNKDFLPTPPIKVTNEFHVPNPRVNTLPSSPLDEHIIVWFRHKDWRFNQVQGCFASVYY